MTKLNKYLKEIEEHIQTSYKIGTEAPAFREDVEVLLKIIRIQQQALYHYMSIDSKTFKNMIDCQIPGGSDDWKKS